MARNRSNQQAINQNIPCHCNICLYYCHKETSDNTLYYSLLPMVLCFRHNMYIWLSRLTFYHSRLAWRFRWKIFNLLYTLFLYQKLQSRVITESFLKIHHFSPELTIHHFSPNFSLDISQNYIPLSRPQYIHNAK